MSLLFRIILLSFLSSFNNAQLRVLNCERYESSNFFAPCVECEKNFKLIDNTCIECEPADTHRDCTSTGFSFGSTINDDIYVPNLDGLSAPVE